MVSLTLFISINRSSLIILQPAFQAINIEPEENIDEQIDTTKELHVSEKRAQTCWEVVPTDTRSMKL